MRGALKFAVPAACQILSNASLLSLRSSEPSSFACRGVPPPRHRGCAVGSKSRVAPESSILRSQGALGAPKLSPEGLSRVGGLRGALK